MSALPTCGNGSSGIRTPWDGENASDFPDPDGRNYRFGSRFGMNRSLDLTLEGRRGEIRAGNPEHELTVRGRLNW